MSSSISASATSALRAAAATPGASKLLTFGGGALAVGAGVGAVALAAKATGDSGHRRLVSGVLAGTGVAAGVGAALLRNTRAFGPLAGLGVGLAAAGIVDAIRGGGGAKPAPLGERANLKPGDLLPDGEQAAPTTVTREGDSIRFDSVVGNRGAAPLQLSLHLAKEGTSDTGSTNQVIFNEDGTAKERPLQGGLRLDERRDHSHLHFDDFVYFQMYKADGNGRPDTAAGELAQGVKQSFYITDVQKYDGTSAANLEKAGKLKEKGMVDRGIIPADVMQGISVGNADVYGAGLEGQSLNVGDIAPGRYVLRETFDPNDEVIEQDEHNNAADTLIEIGADGKLTTIRSGFAPASDYTQLDDGRSVIPSVVESMKKNVHDHENAAEREEAATNSPLFPSNDGGFIGPIAPGHTR
ncbi:MAG: hypothetical protein JWM98_3143 [Thermoleophilia bacterium]|nr:hypothetical protein [Thermoleophilia bacterium]